MSDKQKRRRWLLGLALVSFVFVVTTSALIVFSRLRESAYFLRCPSNLRQIGQAILLYSNDNHGQCPPDLASLIEAEEMSPETFVCPSADERAAGGASQKEIARNFRQGKHCSYVYLGTAGSPLADVHPDAVLVYEPLRNHGKDGANILFGDGHVEWKDPQWMKAFLQQLLSEGPQPGPLLPKWEKHRSFPATTSRS